MDKKHEEMQKCNRDYLPIDKQHTPNVVSFSSIAVRRRLSAPSSPATSTLSSGKSAVGDNPRLESLPAKSDAIRTIFVVAIGDAGNERNEPTGGHCCRRREIIERERDAGKSKTGKFLAFGRRDEEFLLLKSRHCHSPPLSRQVRPRKSPCKLQSRMKFEIRQKVRTRFRAGEKENHSR